MKKQAREDERARNHESSLVEVDASLGSTGRDRVSLGDLWFAVSAAVSTKGPPADVMVLDDRRLDELPSRWPRSGGWMQERRLAKWNDAVDRLAVPAWDTKGTLRSPGGIADTFSIDHHALYLGDNDCLYCGPARPTPNGTYAEWQASYGSADDVPGLWSAKWMPYGTYYPRQEIADALASLVAIHNLNLNI